MNITDYKCPCCGAPLPFDSKTQKLHCDSCDNSYDIETVKQFTEADNSSAEENHFDWAEFNGERVEGTVVYTCPSCGGEIIGDSATAATKCPYCDNIAIMQGQISGMLKPDFIIPFKTNKQDAINALKQFYKGKKLLPDLFKDENRIREIRGIYVPFWIFDCETDAHITYNATRVSSWVKGDYRYTKTDHFLAIREGDLSFSQIPADASSKMSDDLMDSLEPFDYSQAVPFENAYLSGYFADKFDVGANETKSRANERVINSTVEIFRETVLGFASVSTRNSSIKTKNGTIKYAFLPVWLLNTKYEGNMYTFAMNGQTGKFIGTLPIDKRKCKKYFFSAFGIIAAVISLLVFLIGGYLL